MNLIDYILVLNVMGNRRYKMEICISREISLSSQRYRNNKIFSLTKFASSLIKLN